MSSYKLLYYVGVIVLLNSCKTIENWQALIKDNDLSEFSQVNGSAEYILDNGVLTGITKHNTPNSFLATNKSFKDFILEFEVKIDNGMNSGVQFRSATHKETGVVFGYQVEIETSDRKWAGGIYDESRRGWLYPLSNNEKGQNAFIRDTWNKYRVEAIGDTIRTWVNGIQCARLIDDVSGEGFIAFQVHSIGEKDNAGQKVQWRNIRIRTDNFKKALWQEDTEVAEINLSEEK